MQGKKSPSGGIEGGFWRLLKNFVGMAKKEEYILVQNDNLYTLQHSKVLQTHKNKRKPGENPVSTCIFIQKV